MPASENIQKLTEKANQGDSEACYELGEYYYRQKEYESAFEFYEKTISCTNPNPTAYFNIAYAYQHGEGTACDPVMAVEYYKIAAKHHLPQAMYNLAAFYMNGLAVPQDCKKAEEYCRNATFELNQLYTRLNRFEIREKEGEQIYGILLERINELERKLKNLQEEYNRLEQRTPGGAEERNLKEAYAVAQAIAKARTKECERLQALVEKQEDELCAAEEDIMALQRLLLSARKEK